MSDIVLQHCCMSLKNFICIINCMIFFVNCSLMIIIVSFTYQHHNKLFTPVGFKNSSFEHFGERALMENKEQREIKSRLQRIEDELSKLHNPEEIEVTGGGSSGSLRHHSGRFCWFKTWPRNSVLSDLIFAIKLSYDFLV